MILSQHFQAADSHFLLMLRRVLSEQPNFEWFEISTQILSFWFNLPLPYNVDCLKYPFILNFSWLKRVRIWFTDDF